MPAPGLVLALPGPRGGASVTTQRVWRLHCVSGRLIALHVSGRRVGRVLRRVGLYWVLVAYGSFRSVAIYQCIPTAKLDAAAATMLFDFLLLYEEHLVCWRDGLTP
jgi:hypothetical protein